MSKKYSKVLIILISLILISFGIIIYLRYIKTSEKNKSLINNYYSSEFLFNNNYIKLANSIDNAKDINNDLDIHTNNDVLYINLLNQSKEINKLPKKANVYFNQLENDCYEFAALKGKNLYYAKTCLSNNGKKSFEKISTIAKSIYVPNIYKKGMYVNEKPKSNFIVDTKSEKLKYISSKKGSLGLYNDISETRPYFDYICASDNISICRHLIFYISFSNELFYNDEVVKDTNGKKLIVNDLVGILKVSSTDNIDMNDLDYETLKKYEYQYELYVTDKDNYLYKIIVNKNTDDKLEIEKIGTKKIKSIDYKKDKDDSVNNIIITDTDGKTIGIKNEKNSIVSTSTIYERK